MPRERCAERQHTSQSAATVCLRFSRSGHCDSSDFSLWIRRRPPGKHQRDECPGQILAEKNQRHDRKTCQQGGTEFFAERFQAAKCSKLMLSEARRERSKCSRHGCPPGRIAARVEWWPTSHCKS